MPGSDLKSRVLGSNLDISVPSRFSTCDPRFSSEGDHYNAILEIHFMRAQFEDHGLIYNRPDFAGPSGPEIDTGAPSMGHVIDHDESLGLRGTGGSHQSKTSTRSTISIYSATALPLSADGPEIIHRCEMNDKKWCESSNHIRLANTKNGSETTMDEVSTGACPRPGCTALVAGHCPAVIC